MQKFQQILEQGANSSAQWWNVALAGDADTESPIDQGGRAGAELLSSEGLNGHDDDGDAALRDLKHAVGIQNHLTRTIDDLNLEALQPGGFGGGRRRRGGAWARQHQSRLASMED